MNETERTDLLGSTAPITETLNMDKVGTFWQ